MTFLQRHAYAIGARFAACLWPLFPRRRRLATDNVLRCGVAADVKTARRIAFRSWCHLAGHICEALCVPKVVTRENWREHLDFSDADPETVRLLLDSPGTPILIVSSHHGVWEAATNILSFARPMIAVARTMNSRFVTRWLEKHHFRGRIEVIDKNRGFSGEVLRRWRERGAAMTLLMDQHTARGEKLRFFGRPAYTFTSPARLAIRSGLPIVVGSFVRIAPYRYRLVGGAPVVFPRDADRATATQLLNDRIEAAIRKYPEQYLWAHRRWRND